MVQDGYGPWVMASMGNGGDGPWAMGYVVAGVAGFNIKEFKRNSLLKF
jgi:hypothetical protein